MLVMIFAIPTISHFYSGASNQKPKMNIVSYSLTSNSFTLFEPIIVECVVHNTTPGAVMIDLGQDRKENFRMTLTYPNNHTQTSKKEIREGIAMIGEVTVQAGLDYKQNLLINEWFNITNPGKYNLVIQLSTPIRTTKGNILANNASASINFEVLPKDTEKLRITCEKLFNDIVGSNSYQEASELTMVLGYIKDSVAVPYLDKLVRGNKMVERIAIEGLGRINSTESVQALINLLNVPNQELRALVRAVLVQNESTSTDASLKQQIKSALGIK